MIQLHALSLVVGFVVGGLVASVLWFAFGAYHLLKKHLVPEKPAQKRTKQAAPQPSTLPLPGIPESDEPPNSMTHPPPVPIPVRRLSMHDYLERLRREHAKVKVEAK